MHRLNGVTSKLVKGLNSSSDSDLVLLVGIIRNYEYWRGVSIVESCSQLLKNTLRMGASDDEAITLLLQYLPAMLPFDHNHLEDAFYMLKYNRDNKKLFKTGL